MTDDSIYFFDSPKRQYFSFPFSVISYITENPLTVLGCQKLQKTCKYFFSKKKIVITNLDFMYYADGLYCLDGIYGPEIPLSWEGGKFWPMQRFDIIESTGFPQNIYRYDFIIELSIEKSTLNQSEIDILFSNKKLISLFWRVVNVEINGVVDNSFTIDKLLSKVTTISKFIYSNPGESFTAETFQKLNTLHFYENFEYFSIKNFAINHEMDPSNFCNFIKKNAAAKAKLAFDFPLDARRNNFWGLKAAKDKVLWKWPDQTEKPEIIFNFHP